MIVRMWHGKVSNEKAESIFIPTEVELGSQTMAFEPAISIHFTPSKTTIYLYNVVTKEKRLTTIRRKSLITSVAKGGIEPPTSGL